METWFESRGQMGGQAAVVPEVDIVQAMSLFPTPVVRARLPDAVALNAELTAQIDARIAGYPSVAKSNLGGWQSDDDFPAWGGAPARRLVAAVCALADRVTVLVEDGALVRRGVPWRVNAWVNVNGAGDANDMHAHPGAYWSCVYYVAADDLGAAAGGELEFHDPRGTMPTMYAPQLKAAFEGCVTAGLWERLQPATGELILFPSWLLHAVRPYHGPARRISIAFNLCL
ncbi:TIGR02466 family protein [Parapedomonas caeni]